MADSERTLEQLVTTLVISETPLVEQPVFADTLPIELLCYIFRFLRFKERVSTSQVCRRWRSASIGAPGQLWNKVKSKHHVSGALTHWLARAGTSVRLHVFVNDTNALEVSTALESRMGSLRALIIRIDGSISESHCQTLSASFARPAPLLKHLVLEDSLDMIYQGLYDAASNFFAGLSPRLECFKLFGDPTGYTTNLAFVGLRQFLYCPVIECNSQIIQQCCDISPDLGVFGLETSHWTSGESVSIVLPPSLRAFLITVFRSQDQSIDIDEAPFDPNDILRVIEHAPLDVVCIRFLERPHEDMTSNLFTNLVRNTNLRPRSITIDAWRDQRLSHIEIVCQDDRIREFVDTPLVLPADMFAYITTLSITEGQWPNARSWPDAPTLQTLVIFLVTPIFLRGAANFDSVLVLDPAAPSPRLVCPSLNMLAFSAREAGDAALLGLTPALAPDTIREFIEYHLDIGSRAQVPVLSMNGVQIAQNVVPEVIRLLAIVGNVTTAQGHPKPARLATQDLLHWR